MELILDDARAIQESVMIDRVSISRSNRVFDKQLGRDETTVEEIYLGAGRVARKPAITETTVGGKIRQNVLTEIRVPHNVRVRENDRVTIVDSNPILQGRIFTVHHVIAGTYNSATILRCVEGRDV